MFMLWHRIRCEKKTTTPICRCRASQSETNASRIAPAVVSLWHACLLAFGLREISRYSQTMLLYRRQPSRLYVLGAKGCVVVARFDIPVYHAHKCIHILTSVSPLICSDSAVLINAGRASCFTLTSPQYMNWMRSFSAEWLTLFRNTAR